MMRALGLAGLALIAGACARPSVVSEATSVRSDSVVAVTELARFRDARALAADPAGRLYVVDAAESAVAMLATDGARLNTLGGPGTGTYAFLDPADVDPANGLDLFVADAGNGRIQRYSTDGRFIETIPVPTGETLGDQREQNAGSPIAVAVGAAQSLYAIEEQRGVVLHWEAGRRLMRVLGDQTAGPGALAEPVDLAVGPEGRVFVADRRRGAVLVYDALGTFVRAVPGEPAGAVHALALARAPEGVRLLVVGPRAVAVHRVEGGLTEVLAFDLDEPLVDAAVVGDALVVLTATRLLRAD
ncbi:MAG: hypothetical protein HKN04_12610 [Rhodothermaceae bacterium]|nr:hypothetical protein [Rhodothermaceae bacterium]